jgi:hypothetical protein
MTFGLCGGTVIHVGPHENSVRAVVLHLGGVGAATARARRAPPLPSPPLPPRISQRSLHKERNGNRD